MSRCQIVAECCTNWAGDYELLADMVRAAAEAGADYCKFQSYQVKHLSKSDPQYDWLKNCELDDKMHGVLMRLCESEGVKFLTTVFTLDDLARVKHLGVRDVKIGHGESGQDWWHGCKEVAFVSWPWGRVGFTGAWNVRPLAVVPLYPAPLEALAGLTFLDGYSDHTIGTTAAKWAMANGAKALEKHFHIVGRGRNQSWAMHPAELRLLRSWADSIAVIRSGNRNAERWNHTSTA